MKIRIDFDTNGILYGDQTSAEYLESQYMADAAVKFVKEY